VVEGEAELDGVVVIYRAGARPDQIAERGEIELSRLVVARSARGNGLGRQLVQLCLRRGEECDASGAVLWSQPHQVEAHRLYGALGFSRAPQRDRENAEGPQLVFVRQL
jgi:ribosomal protein S18 acetylase RimI-like enzyme